MSILYSNKLLGNVCRPRLLNYCCDLCFCRRIDGKIILVSLGFSKTNMNWVHNFISNLDSQNPCNYGSQQVKHVNNN